MNDLRHVLLPCKMNSRRIPRKNLQTLGGKSLLEWSIDRFQKWYPDATVWVATEDANAAGIAIRRNCRVYPLSLEDLNDSRNVSGLFSEWLHDRHPDERCMVYQVTSPFVFRSELERGINDPRPYCCSAWIGKLHLPERRADGWRPLSQEMPNQIVMSGNYGVSWGRHVVTGEEETTHFVPVSWLSAIDIDTPEDMVLAEWIIQRIDPRLMED